MARKVWDMGSWTYRRDQSGLGHELRNSTPQSLGQQIRPNARMKEALTGLTPVILVEVCCPENGQ